MEDIYKKSLELHKKFGGKLEIKSKVPLKDRNDLSLAYTPGVAQVSIEIGKDPARVYDYTIKKNSIAVVSDGSAILGLGNLGALAALPVMEGKAILFREFACIDAFPICLDTQDTEEIIKAVKMIAPVFGGINLEDISAPRCFEIERRLRAELAIPVMHDDQHGTATVVLAALINTLKLRGSDKENTKIVINGAGSAGIAIAKLLLTYGFTQLILCDSKGILNSEREGLAGEKLEVASSTNKTGLSGGLSEALAGADVFVGVSKPGLLNAAMIRSMNPKAVILAMANPIPEIMPEEALAGGAFIVATGRSDFPNQINNVLAFPGLFRGALDRRIKQFTEATFLAAAEALAAYVENPTPEQILPSPLDHGVAKVISAAVE
ncbi:MAG: malate dehydrogenase [Candidatus Doudnabacteria bacterium RIFCSPHIGHO2_01_FULL_50_11]|uniref:Malate dehydrogenase n=1 Tax=Candidatus Doudnabacteria bacterium RIFCSPHIGHO2_01_FULL_50_11 TaxID=1817828 RepID=A0A1F5PFS4_9BACT|nr:MAG: malate dehydrogenase [Candidatus Doudnabacteria bacterium RIFCSPHIGHO2_01_FULL_50_11]